MILVEEGQVSTQTHQNPQTPQQNQNQNQNKKPTTLSANTPFHGTVNLTSKSYSTINFPRYPVHHATEEQIYPYGRYVKSKGKRLPIEKPTIKL